MRKHYRKGYLETFSSERGHNGRAGCPLFSSRGNRHNFPLFLPGVIARPYRGMANVGMLYRGDMVEVVSGDIWQTSAKAIVVPVNTVGVAGKGLALQCKRLYPEWYVAYRKACERKEIKPGRVWVWSSEDGRYIIAFPTKEHWRQSSRLNDIRLGLYHLVRVMRAYEIPSIAIPALGCGLGGLEWDVVRSMILGIVGVERGVMVWVYGPR